MNAIYSILDLIGRAITQTILVLVSFTSCPPTTLESEPQPLLRPKGFAFLWIKNIWRDEWWDFVIMRSIPRYFFAVIRSIWVLFSAIRRSLGESPVFVQLSDTELGHEMRDNYCHLLKKLDDSAPASLKEFAKNNLQKSKLYLYLDCSFMGRNPNILCLDGRYLCGTLTVFEYHANDMSILPIAIQITRSQTEEFWVTPADQAWSSAKRLAFTAAHYLVTFNSHPLTHFPQDCVYFSLRETVPQGHWLRQLLIPHFRFSASVTDSVFYNKFTVFNTIGKHVWSIPPSTVLHVLHQDLSDYRWTPYLEEPPAETPHSITRQLYHNTILNFVEKIISANGNSGNVLDTHVTEWVAKVSTQLKGFPDVDAMRKDPQLLTLSLTKMILIVSFDHTVDHWWIRMRDPRIIEWVIRTPPPKHAQDAVPVIRTRWDLVGQDVFNWCCPFGIFTYIPLCDVTYPFENAFWQEWTQPFLRATHQIVFGKPLASQEEVLRKERKAAEDFRRELRDACKVAEERGFTVPMEIVSASVEY